MPWYAKILPINQGSTIKVKDVSVLEIHELFLIQFERTTFY